jgi:hypothetical protein
MTYQAPTYYPAPAYRTDQAFTMIDDYFETLHSTMWRDDELKAKGHPERNKVVDKFIDELILMGFVRPRDEELVERNGDAPTSDEDTHTP